MILRKSNSLMPCIKKCGNKPVFHQALLYGEQILSFSGKVVPCPRYHLCQQQCYGCRATHQIYEVLQYQVLHWKGLLIFWNKHLDLFGMGGTEPTRKNNANKISMVQYYVRWFLIVKQTICKECSNFQHINHYHQIFLHESDDRQVQCFHLCHKPSFS